MQSGMRFEIGYTCSAMPPNTAAVRIASVLFRREFILELARFT